MTNPTPNTPWNRTNWEETESPPKLSPPVVPCWMSKREYFAALAMQGYLAGDTSKDRDSLMSAVDVADFAVDQADKLIAALEA